MSNSLQSLTQGTCYWQNSTLAPDSPYSIAPNDVPCFPEQTNSPCCATGWSCLSDGVCYIEQSGNGFYYRGTCTDRTWNSQQCPGWCFAQNSNTSIPLLKCTEASGEDWYCCPGDDNCSCNTGQDALKLGASQPTTVTVIGSTSWPGFVSTSTAFSQSVFAVDGTTTMTGLTTSPVITSTMNSTMSTATSGSRTAGAAAATSSRSSGPDVVTKSSTNIGAIVGGVVGGVIALALIGLLGWFLGRRQSRRNAESHRSNFSSGADPRKPYAPEMGAGPENHAGAWAAAQQKLEHGYYPESELPSTGSRTKSEVAGDQTYPPPRHELGNEGQGQRRADGMVEMQG